MRSKKARFKLFIVKNVPWLFRRLRSQRGTTSSLEPEELSCASALPPLARLCGRDSERGTTAGLWESGIWMTLFQELPTVSVCQPGRVGGIDSESRRDWVDARKISPQ